LKVIITLTGPSCSGKTTLENSMITNHVANRIVSHTTRQMRDNEKDEVNYNFVSEDRFEELVSEGEIIHKSEFSGESYGLVRESLDKACGEEDVGVIVVTPGGLRQIKETVDNEDDLVLLSYFVTNTTQTLVTRMLNRFIEQPDPHSTLEFFATRVISLVQKELRWGMGCYNMLYRETLTLTDVQDKRDSLNLIIKDIANIRCAYS
jgi:guanylate kinase